MLAVGVTQDRLFGPVIMFGFGGTTGDLMDDRASR
jgi:acyl-CoA synthetase (NDP forming)